MGRDFPAHAEWPSRRWADGAVVVFAVGDREDNVVVEEPLTGYTRYQLAGYAESQAAGEEIRIVRRTAAPALATLRRDFWLFDQGTPIAFALLLDYSPTGEWRGGEIITDSQALLDLQAERDLALQWAVPLNEYLAQMA